MSENTKVLIAIECPYCQKKITLRKGVNVVSSKIDCPSCHRQLNLLFNVNTRPQTYEYVTEDALKEKKNKTIYGRNNTDEYYIDDYEVPVKAKTNKRKLHFRGNAFLTHIRMLGLSSQKYPLSEGETIIGRYDTESPSDISIKGDITMSRRSVAIIIEEEDDDFVFKLKVLNALNPIKVNGIQIIEGRSTYLEFGDEIIMGNSRFKFDNH